MPLAAALGRQCRYRLMHEPRHWRAPGFMSRPRWPGPAEWHPKPTTRPGCSDVNQGTGVGDQASGFEDPRRAAGLTPAVCPAYRAGIRDTAGDSLRLVELMVSPAAIAAPSGERTVTADVSTTQTLVVCRNRAFGDTVNLRRAAASSFHPVLVSISSSQGRSFGRAPGQETKTVQSGQKADAVAVVANKCSPPRRRITSFVTNSQYQSVTTPLLFWKRVIEFRCRFCTNEASAHYRALHGPTLSCRLLQISTNYFSRLSGRPMALFKRVAAPRGQAKLPINSEAAWYTWSPSFRRFLRQFRLAVDGRDSPTLMMINDAGQYCYTYSIPLIELTNRNIRRSLCDYISDLFHMSVPRRIMLLTDLFDDVLDSKRLRILLGYGPCMAEVYAAFCRVSWDMWTRAWIGWVLRGVRVRA